MNNPSSRRALAPAVLPSFKVEPIRIENEHNDDSLTWDEDQNPKINYANLGRHLAASGDLFRARTHGLIAVSGSGEQLLISTGNDLRPVIIDRVHVIVVKGSKPRGSVIPALHLNAMLKCEAFLQEFQPVDRVSPEHVYLPGFVLTQPGYNDGGEDQRFHITAGPPEICSDCDAVNRFLDVMDFSTNADRTNAVALALTVLLRNHWPGGKPIGIVTASKSHAGKDTVIQFASGVPGTVSISYESTGLKSVMIKALKTHPDAGLLVVENARLAGRQPHITSAFLERFVTDPRPLLATASSQRSEVVVNHFVTAISTNYGRVSEDLMNRGLPIHLEPTGDVRSRKSPIGNPRHEYLPKNREQIAAELRGMVECWKEAGRPLANDIEHPFTVWARTVGGILQANGYTEFLANYASQFTRLDPVREALGQIALERPDEWLRPAEWVETCVHLGLASTLLPGCEPNVDARRLAMGKLLGAHKRETLHVESEEGAFVFGLEQARKRSIDGKEYKNAKPCYRFAAINVIKTDDRGV